MQELYMLKYNENGINHIPTFRSLDNALRMAKSLCNRGLEVYLEDLSQVETRGL